MAGTKMNMDMSQHRLLAVGHNGWNEKKEECWGPTLFNVIQRPRGKRRDSQHYRRVTC